MNVQQLIERLQSLPPEAEVKIFSNEYVDPLHDLWLSREGIVTLVATNDLDTSIIELDDRDRGYTLDSKITITVSEMLEEAEKIKQLTFFHSNSGYKSGEYVDKNEQPDTNTNSVWIDYSKLNPD